MKKHQYSADYFDVNGGGNSYVKFAKGKVYAITEETSRHAAQGFCEEVEVEDEVDTAAAEQAQLEAAAAEQTQLEAAAAEQAQLEAAAAEQAMLKAAAPAAAPPKAAAKR